MSLCIGPPLPPVTCQWEVLLVRWASQHRICSVFKCFCWILCVCPRLVIFNLYLIPMYYLTLIGHAFDTGVLTGQLDFVWRWYVNLDLICSQPHCLHFWINYLHLKFTICWEPYLTFHLMDFFIYIYFITDLLSCCCGLFGACLLYWSCLCFIQAYSFNFLGCCNILTIHACVKDPWASLYCILLNQISALWFRRW
jgi:hypothetical protein